MTPDPTHDTPPTSWSLLGRATDPSQNSETRAAARQEIIRRYHAFAVRCLSAVFRGQPELVDEVISDFSAKVLEGNALAHADPEKGRFRLYLQRVLRNLAMDHFRRQARLHAQLAEDADPPAPAPLDDDAFCAQWRIELTMQAMNALAESGRERDRELFAVLQLKMAPEQLSLAAMATQLTETLGRPVTANWVGSQVFNARKRLRELVRREVRKSLADPTEDAVDAELADLGMLGFVREKKPGSAGE